MLGTATLNQAFYFDFNSANGGGGGGRLNDEVRWKDVYSGHYNNNTPDNYGAGIFSMAVRTTLATSPFGCCKQGKRHDFYNLK
jgi:hypothetical protein